MNIFSHARVEAKDKCERRKISTRVDCAHPIVDALVPRTMLPADEADDVLAGDDVDDTGVGANNFFLGRSCSTSSSSSLMLASLEDEEEEDEEDELEDEPRLDRRRASSATIASSRIGVCWIESTI